MTEKYNKSFYVAGVKFRKGWKENIARLEEGQTLNLVPDPSNRFDPDAIIISGSEKGETDIMILGFVPAKTGEAKEVAALLRRGIELKATLLELSADFEPWKALLVEIEEV